VARGEWRGEDVERTSDFELRTSWVETIVENHLGNGDWGDGATAIEFDGHTLVAHHAREHLRGLAMIVLAKYLGDGQSGG